MSQKQRQPPYNWPVWQHTTRCSNNLGTELLRLVNRNRQRRGR